MKKTLISLLTRLFVTFTPITQAAVEAEQHLPQTEQQIQTEVRIDLNQASQAELEAIAGLGEVKSRAILAKREELGKFEDLEQLLQVNGIGPKTLDRISPYLSVE